MVRRYAEILEKFEGNFSGLDKFFIVCLYIVTGYLATIIRDDKICEF